MFSKIAFIVPLSCGLTLLVLAIYSITTGRLRLWPPQERRSWHRSFFAFLFRGFFYGMIATTWFEITMPSGLIDYARIVAGFIFFATGFGFAFRITGQLGWKSAFGEKRRLKTDGWFSYSRNPIYVATWFGLLGWALMAMAWQVTLLALIWASLYLLIPRLEEPWLENHYGEEYRIYRTKTPRFI